MWAEEIKDGVNVMRRRKEHEKERRSYYTFSSWTESTETTSQSVFHNYLSWLATMAAKETS